MNLQISDADFESVAFAPPASCAAPYAPGGTPCCAPNDATCFAGMAGPRQADGSLPVLPFLRLATTSPLIDKGTPSLGFPYAGKAPDLGAFETGLPYGLFDGGASGSSSGGRAPDDGGESDAGGGYGGNASDGTSSSSGSSGGQSGEGASDGGSGMSSSGAVSGGSSSGSGGAVGDGSNAGGSSDSGGLDASLAPGSDRSDSGGADSAGGPKADATAHMASAGCGCRIGGDRSPSESGLLFGIGVFGLLRRRARRSRAPNGLADRGLAASFEQRKARRRELLQVI